MTASQFTGGSFKHVDPSNYSTGKQGSEVTIHWAVADGAPIEEQHAMGERARVEAIRLAMGTNRPYNDNKTVEPVPPTPASAAAQEAMLERLAAVVTTPPVPTPAPAPTSTSSGPMSVHGTTAAPAVVGSAPDASTPSASPVSDAALIEAATYHASRVCNPPAPQDPVSREINARKVSAVIAEYVRPPQKLVHIPAEKRQEFLDKLAAL